MRYVRTNSLTWWCGVNLALCGLSLMDIGLVLIGGAVIGLRDAIERAREDAERRHTEALEGVVAATVEMTVTGADDALEDAEWDDGEDEDDGMLDPWAEGGSRA